MKKYVASKNFTFEHKHYNIGDFVSYKCINDRFKKLGLIKKHVEPAVTEDDLELLTEDPIDAVVSVTVEEVVEEVVEEDGSPDWEWINSLKSTRKNKALFDEYASEKFGINLDASEKIVDMIEDFRSQLESL